MNPDHPVSFERCSDLLSALPITFYRYHPKSGGQFYSGQVVALTGYSQEELEDTPFLWHDSIHPDDLRKVDDAIEKIKNGKKSFDLEYRFRKKDGEWAWLHDRCIRRVSIEDDVFIEGVATDISRQKTSELALRDSERQLLQILDSLDDGVILYDQHGFRLLNCNAASISLFGYDKKSLLKIDPAKLFPSRQQFDTVDQTARKALQTRNAFSTECMLQRADGSVFPARLRIRRVEQESTGKVFVAVIADLTKEQEYEQSLALARQVFDNAAEAVMITDAENRIVSVNTAFSQITGWPKEESIGRNPSFLSSGKQSPEFYRDMWKILRETGVWQGEVVNRRKSGQYYPEWLSISTVRNRQGAITHYLAIFSDVTERKRAEGLIHKYSWFDSLTDLPNKALLIDRINQAITNAQNEGKSLYVIAINLNRLKHINDSYGHSTGDEILKAVAQRLVAGTREGDTVSRITGDDFVVLAPRLGQPHRAIALAERLLESVGRPIELNGNSLQISANAGIATFPSDGTSADLLLQNADAALNHARSMGIGLVMFFEPHMNASILEKITLQAELTEAVARNEFLLHFQPQANLMDGSLVGMETLIRWKHPTRGYISPALFIPAAEESGLIIQIGDWIIHETCRSIAHWRSLGHDDLLVAINLSSHQFSHPQLVNTIQSALQQYQIPASCVELEITEGVAMEDANEVLSRLNELKNTGIRIAIDDFGTGYSSLSYLRKFSVDKLKIDQSFVRDMNDSREALSIVNAIVALGHGLGLKVIAEGVESKDQLESLRSIGCDEIQGYIFSRPIPMDEMTQWLQNERHTDRLP